MKITELEQLLSRLKKLHGDVEIFLRLSNGEGPKETPFKGSRAMYRPIKRVEYREDVQTEQCSALLPPPLKKDIIEVWGYDG